MMTVMIISNQNWEAYSLKYKLIVSSVLSILYYYHFGLSFYHGDVSDDENDGNAAAVAVKDDDGDDVAVSWKKRCTVWSSSTQTWLWRQQYSVSRSSTAMQTCPPPSPLGCLPASGWGPPWLIMCRCWEREREADRQTDRQTERERERQTDRERDRDTERDRQRKRERERGGGERERERARERSLKLKLKHLDIKNGVSFVSELVYIHV